VQETDSKTLLASCFTVVSFLAYILDLRLKKLYFSLSSVDRHEAIRCRIPDERTLPSHSCKNLMKKFENCPQATCGAAVWPFYGVRKLIHALP
jgi:hypothetical protein